MWVSRSIPTPVGKPCSQPTPGIQRKVYPHACGETRGELVDRGLGAGLSPRLWGNRAELGQHGRKRRSIPTPVGKPTQDRNIRIINEVYPHACGETRQQKNLSQTLTGLSPRLWGNLSKNSFEGIISRSIPTPVGKP